MTSAFEVGEPILNSPYEEPGEHWWLHEGHTPERRPGRRAAGYFYRDPRASLPEAGATRGDWQELELINLIRERVARWRAEEYPGVSRTTLELLRHWRRDGRRQRLFFAQLEAAETVIFLTEARSDLLQGVDVPPEPGGEFRRFACKMATGAGKTTVMAMIAAWSILNKVAAKGDARFSDVLLAVCPNVTIRRRLRELDPNEDEASIYRTRDLVPAHLMPSLRKGRVLVKNWHEFERKGMSAGAKVQRNGVPETFTATIKIGPKTTSGRAGRYLTEAEFERQIQMGLLKIIKPVEKDGKLVEVKVEETRYVESDTALLRRILGREVGGKQNILVLNDEAHHAYRIAQAEPDEDVDAEALDEEAIEEFAQEATVWVDGLDRIHKGRGINFCLDLSATPYYLARAGANTNKIFPWVVSEFGLTDAIESGLVKIPQLAVSDPTGAEQAKYFNIWRWIMSQLTAAERGGKLANPKPEAVLKWAGHPIQLLGTDWEALRKEWESAEDEPREPVFILVCKNTRLAKVIYEWLAEGTAPTGLPLPHLAALRNAAGRINTIRVDSKVVEESNGTGAKADENTWMRHTLDTVGKRDWPRDDQGRPLYPEGFEALAKKLDRPLHPPGRDVRCIVSVGMLTEGWDCSTVTHIIGLRPFMSQLLCEQVVGRGLRRASYDVGDDGKLKEEVAKVLGVPFEIIPFKQTSTKSPSSSKQHHVHAVREKVQFEITFPRVEGYLQSIRNRVAVDWKAVPPLTIDPLRIPPEVLLKAGLQNNRGKMSLVGPGRLDGLDLSRWRREISVQEEAFKMAAALTKDYVEQPTCEAPAHVLFPQMLAIVQRFVAAKVESSEPDGVKDMFLSPYYGWAIERLVGAIRPDTSGGEAPEVPRYERSRPPGTTAEVDFWTAKEVREVVKSHLDYVVADTKQWEQAAAYQIDRHPRVGAFVKNQGLGFVIPYLDNGQPHDYIPDFVIRFDNGLHLILETKGYDPLKDVKAAAARRWVAAVNADRRFGEWRYEMATEVGAVRAILDAVATGEPVGA